MVLLAVCDAEYSFTLFDFGSYDTSNDCGVLASSLLGKGFESNRILLPPDERLYDCTVSPLRYYLLGDDDFFLNKKD